MRISIMALAVLLTFSMVLAANPGFGQQELEQEVQVSFDGLSLAKALEKLQNQTGLPLAYTKSALPDGPKIHYSARKKAREILDDLLDEVGMTYRVENGFVLLTEKNGVSPTAPAERRMADIEVRGTVRDSLGESLPGVSVVLKGQPQIGTTTDLNGRYILTVPDNATLVFSYMGFRDHEEPVRGREVVDVVLYQTQAGLDEVVVVGFGTQKKISLVGAQSTVEAKQLQVPAGNLTNTLVGRLAGVVAVQRTGEPGFDDSDIWIRGVSTFTEGLSQPLVLVDGVPREMANVDPEDIESFTILKDASATAVYGVRGANGVVIIKTKSGQAGKPRFNFRYYEGLTTFTKLPDFADGPTYMRMSNEALTNRGANPLYSEERIRMTEEGSDPYLYPNVDWMDVLFKDFGRQRRANLNIGGGSDRVRYYVGTSYYDESGLYEEGGEVRYNYQVGVKRYNLTSNLNIEASNTTRVELGLQGYLMNANYPGTGQAGIFEDAWFVTPVIHPPRYENGEIADQRAGSLGNPYGSMTETGYANQWRNQLYSNLRVTQDLPFVTEGLSATGMFSFDVYNYTSMRRTKRPDSYLAIGRDENGEMQYEQTHEGERYLNFARNSEGERTIYIEAALNYNRSFGKHDVTGMFLFNKSDRLNSQASNLINSLPYRFMGVSGRAAYGYDNRYFAEFNFGYNGSENFAPSNRYGFFPSMGLGWVISEENFFEPLKAGVQMLKLRFSHGKVGSSQIASGDRRFAYISTIGSAAGYYFGPDRSNSEFATGRNIEEYGVDVSWETSTKTNVGVDLYTAGNALNVQLDLFKERREGIFLRRSAVPSYVGLQNAPFGNLGIIENKGLDGSLSYSRSWNDFSFQVLGNFTFTRNEVIENDQPVPTYPWLDSRGQKVRQRFGLIALGLFESEEEIANGPLHPGLVRPGDIKFKDMNGDGIINDFDRVPIGYGVIPELVYGAGFSLRYKSVALSAMFQGVGNVDIHMQGEGVMPFSVSLSRGNVLSNIEDRWTIDNPRQDAFYPRLSDGSPNSNYTSSTWWVKNGRYLRLKDVQLTYTLKQSFVERLGFTNANIFLAGFNVATWSPFKFWDVELGDGRGTSYPNTSAYTMGVNLSF